MSNGVASNLDTIPKKLYFVQFQDPHQCINSLLCNVITWIKIVENEELYSHALVYSVHNEIN